VATTTPPTGVDRPWPDVRAAGVDLRAGVDDADTLPTLVAVASGLVSTFAGLDPADGPAAIVVRHHPAPSGRASGSLATEVVTSACRSFFRQLRYDKDWLHTPVVFVDGRDADDDDLRAVVVAALAGQARIDLERSTGPAAGYGWERGDTP
jgi:hypothetical protein